MPSADPTAPPSVPAAPAPAGGPPQAAAPGPDDGAGAPRPAGSSPQAAAADPDDRPGAPHGRSGGGAADLVRGLAAIAAAADAAHGSAPPDPDPRHPAAHDPAHRPDVTAEDPVPNPASRGADGRDGGPALARAAEEGRQPRDVTSPRREAPVQGQDTVRQVAIDAQAERGQAPGRAAGERPGDTLPAQERPSACQPGQRTPDAHDRPGAPAHDADDRPAAPGALPAVETRHPDPSTGDVHDRPATNLPAAPGALPAGDNRAPDPRTPDAHDRPVVEPPASGTFPAGETRHPDPSTRDVHDRPATDRPAAPGALSAVDNRAPDPRTPDAHDRPVAPAHDAERPAAADALPAGENRDPGPRGHGAPEPEAAPTPAHAVLAERRDGTVVRVGGTVAKAHAVDSVPGDLAVRLALAGHPRLRGIVLAPRAVGAQFGGRTVSVWPYGDPVDRRQAQAAPWEAAAALLARLHAVPLSTVGGAVPGMRGPAKVARAMARLGALPDSADAEAVRAAWRLLPPWARGEQPYRGRRALCHGDWHLGQLVRHPAPDGPWQLIDVDDLGAGDPAWDLARPAMWFAAGLLPGEAWARFLAAYRAEGGTAVPAEGDPWPRLDVPARALAVQTAAIAVAKAARDGRALDPAESELLGACRRIAQLE